MQSLIQKPKVRSCSFSLAFMIVIFLVRKLWKNEGDVKPKNEENYISSSKEVIVFKYVDENGEKYTT